MSAFTCQLSLYPDYLADAIGADFGETYYADAAARNETDKRVRRFVHQQFGAWGCGEADPDDVFSPTALASVHLTAQLFGAPMLYSARSFADTLGFPLSGLPSIADLRPALPRFFRGVAELCSETARLRAAHSAARIAVPGTAEEIDGVPDLDMVHCPLTIGYKLFGERLLYAFADEPDVAGRAMYALCELTAQWTAELRRAAGRRPPRRALISACSAAFVSPEDYRRAVLPALRAYLGERSVFFHCCGSCNAHLPVFAQLHRTNPFLRFDCRESSGADLRSAAAALPGVTLSYMLSPALCLSRSPKEIGEAVDRARAEAGENPLHLILMLPAGAQPALAHAFFARCVDQGADLALARGFRFV